MPSNLHLVSDLDGTWIPSTASTRGLRDLEGCLSRWPGLSLTFATGRTLHSVLTELSGLLTLWPGHLVADVGTVIYERTANGKWIEDAGYARKIQPRWNTEEAERLARSLPTTVQRQAGVLPRRRLALEVAPDCESKRARDDLVRYLEKAWFPADVLLSNGRCLDVLPKGVDKGTAIEHLEETRRSGLLVVCGDSENDLGMLRRADVAVLMAGSPLKETDMGLPLPRVYRPKTEGPGGIMEALAWLRSGMDGHLVAARPLQEARHG